MFGGFFGPGRSDPFAEMDRMMRNMDREFERAFQHAFEGFPQASTRQPRAFRLGAPARVEELGDHDDAVATRSGHVPRVEEPDDDVPSHSNQSGARDGEQGAGPLTFFGGLTSGLGGLFGGQTTMSVPRGATVQSYSYSYSSSGYGRPVEHREEMHVGPDGGLERRRVVKDGRTGEESVEVHRSLNGRGRTVKRVRGADGQQRAEDQLHGMTSEQAREFDRQWQERRGTYLGGRAQTTTPALPDAEHGGTQASRPVGNRWFGGGSRTHWA